MSLELKSSDVFDITGYLQVLDLAPHLRQDLLDLNSLLGNLSEATAPLKPIWICMDMP